MPSPLDLTTPQPLSGIKPDPTMGRGYLDDAHPTRFTRLADKMAAALLRAVGVLDRVADENFAFNKVGLTPAERAELFMGMGTQELEQAAGIWGPDRIREAQRGIAEGLAREQMQGGVAMPTAPGMMPSE